MGPSHSITFTLTPVLSKTWLKSLTPPEYHVVTRYITHIILSRSKTWLKSLTPLEYHIVTLYITHIILVDPSYRAKFQMYLFKTLFFILENSVLVHNENMIIPTHYLPSSTVPASLHNGLGPPTSVKSKDSPPHTYPQDNLI